MTRTNPFLQTRRLLLYWTSGAFALLPCGCGRDDAAPPPAAAGSAPQATLAESSLPAGWRRYVSSQENFSAVFPGEPTKRDIELGLVVTQLRSGDVTYSIFSEPLANKGSSPDAALEAQREEIAKYPGYESIEQQPISVGKHPGIEMKGSVTFENAGKPAPDCAIRLDRLVATSSRLYQISSVVRDEAKLADARRFLDSFTTAD